MGCVKKEMRVKEAIEDELDAEWHGDGRTTRKLGCEESEDSR